MGLHTTNPPPTSPTHGPNRYKTLPARPKTPKSGHFKRAGRTFSRFHHQSTTHPVQNSPRNSRPLARPVQNSPGTPTINEIRPFLASRENFLPLPTPIHHSPGTKLSQQQPPPGSTGTKLSRHAQKHRNPAISSAQGELFPGSTTTTPSRENFFPVPPPIHHSPGKKLSRQQPPPGPTGTKLSPHAHPLAQPVQNSPSTPKNTEIRPFQARRENFLPVPPPRNRAGRTFSRFHHHLGAYFNAADRLVPTFTRAPDQCAPKLGIVRVIGCSSRCSSRTRRD